MHRSLDDIISTLPHTAIEYAPLNRMDLAQRLANFSSIRQSYSVGDSYIPREGFTIPIDYPLPEIKHIHRDDKALSYIGPSGSILSGLLVAEVDENKRLTIEGYLHPLASLKRFKATGNVEKASIIRLPILFDSIPQLSDKFPVYPVNSQEPENVTLAHLSLGLVQPQNYRPSSMLLTAMQSSFRPYILSLEGSGGKPVYDGKYGIIIKD
jgi:hypothetical protein